MEITRPTSSEYVPRTTEWLIHLDPDYPIGAIDIFPARESQLTSTFCHQFNNSDAASAQWFKYGHRAGKICVDTSVSSLSRHNDDDSFEPRTATERLAWYVAGIIAWLDAAVDKTLANHGEPFELPDYGGSRLYTILFREGKESLKLWREQGTQRGIVELTPVGDTVRAVVNFMDFQNESVWTPKWGDAIRKDLPTTKALWQLLSAGPPVIAPWQAPTTWGELKDCLIGEGTDVLDLVRAGAEHIRDGMAHPLLLGFPIPKTIGDSAERIHWISLLLPVLMTKRSKVAGFRNTLQGRWRHDRTTKFSDGSTLVWMSTENADDSELTSRGRLGSGLCKATVLCVGCGALGSAVCELMVRGGVRDLVVCDPQGFESGNLARHTLVTEDIGRNKAKALASHLRQVSPNACVHVIDEAFPPRGERERKIAAKATVVIDCSANDSLLHRLSKFDFDNEVAAYYLSIGKNAERLFVYSSAAGCAEPEAYLSWIDPWLELERDESGNVEIRPSAGCWHPTFPARADHVWLFAAAGVSWINEQQESGSGGGRGVLRRTELELKWERPIEH